MVHTKPMLDEDKDMSCLCYAWGKVRDQDSLILFNPGSTHNFISKELAARLGIHEHEMGYTMDVKGTIVGQKVLITQMIGKLPYMYKAMWIGRISLSPHSNIKMFYWVCLGSIKGEPS